jgi:hypothetical protein
VIHFPPFGESLHGSVLVTGVLVAVWPPRGFGEEEHHGSEEEDHDLSERSVDNGLGV